MMRYGFLVAASLAALAATMSAQQPDPSAAGSKLTTVLADLVNTPGGAAAVTTESARPRSVRDAMQSRRRKWTAATMLALRPPGGSNCSL